MHSWRKTTILLGGLDEKPGKYWKKDINFSGLLTLLMNRTLLQTIRETLHLLPMGVPVLIIYLIGEWYKFNYQLLPNQRFVIDFSILLGDAVLLHAIALWYLSGMLWKKRGSFSKVGSLLHSVSSAPKVLLSYMGLMLFTQLSFDIFQASPLPIFFILIFFIWAPYLCSFEFFARTLSEQEIEEEEALFESLDEVSYNDIPKRLITRKTWWHLGYLRSIEFTSSKGILALSIVFLLWLVRIVPELFVALSFSPYQSFIAHSIQVFFSWSLGMFVHLTIIKSIYFSLHPEQRDEFDADEKPEGPKDIFSNPVGIRLSILCILVLFVTMVWSERRFQSEGFPESAVRTLESVRFSEEEVILEIKMLDKDQGLRWFHPSRLRLLEISPEEAKKREDKRTSEKNTSEKDPASNKNEDSLTQLIRMMSEKVSSPNRYVVYDTGNDTRGARLEEYQISPRKEEIAVITAFPVRKHADSKTEPLYEISYVNPFGYKEVLFTFKRKAFESDS